MGWLVETVLVCVLVLVFLTLVVLGWLVETVLVCVLVLVSVNFSGVKFVRFDHRHK